MHNRRVLPELRELRYFLAVADTLSFARAAETLHLAPQGLSAAVRRLERKLGVRLFERTTRAVRLTDAGTALVPAARSTLAEAERAVAAARRAAGGETGVVHVGFLGSTANHLLPPVVRAFRERHPDAELRTEEASMASLVAGVRSGRLDAALAREPLLDDETLLVEPVLREPVAAVLPAGHRLAARPVLALADLADEDWVLTERSSWPPWHASYDADFARAGFTPRVVGRGSSVPNLLALVAAGVGVTRQPLSARTLRDSGVVFVPLAGDSVAVVLLRAAGRSRPAVDRFAEVVRRVAATTDLSATG